MDQLPPSSGPSAFRRIKPAGWVMLLLAAGGISYGAWRVIAPRLTAPADPVAPTSPTAPTEPTEPTSPPTEPAPRADRVVPKSLLPREARALPEVRGSVAHVVLPPLNLAPPGDSGAALVGSESAAIDRLVQGTAHATIVSVAALAARPDAVRAGVKAAWFVGTSPLDAGLFPSCDREALEAARLGAVGRSLGHLHLVAALAGEKQPEIQAVPDEAALDRAIAEGRVSGGATRLAREGGTLPRPPCRALPASAFAFVVARRTDRPLSDAELASLAALSNRSVAPEEVAAFFDPARTAPGAFAELFDAASRIWQAAGVIERRATAAEAVDRSFLVAPARAPDAPAAPARTSGGLGYPSWLDRSHTR